MSENKNLRYEKKTVYEMAGTFRIGNARSWER